MSSALLRVRTEDASDLEVVSAAFQDAVFRVGDAAYEARTRRFTIIANRFRWEAGRNERIRSALSSDGVLAVKTHRFQVSAKDAIASVLALKFEPAQEPPGGAVEIALAGGGGIRLDVEALDALMADWGEPWPTPHRPYHERER
jgi:hypothetical protein